MKYLRSASASRILLITAFALSPLKLFAQQPSFEVASVKANLIGRAAGPQRVAADGRRFVASNATLRMLVQFAYRSDDGRPLRNADILGAPNWVDSDRFDIEGTATERAAPVSDHEMQLMVQSLLSERFQFKAHWEYGNNRDIYNLVVAKDGLRLKLSEDQTAPVIGTEQPAPFNPSALPPRGQTRTIIKPYGGTMLLAFSGDSVPISPDLISALQSYLRRPVVDRTGLNGLYDFNLEFVLDTGTAAAPADTPAAADPVGLWLLPAIQEELGLRLESATGTVQILVVDNLRKPSEN